MAIIETQVIATDEDFGYPEHIPDWLVIGGTEQFTVRFCRVCGQLGFEPVAPVGVNDLGGQPEAPRFGADEYLSW